MKHVHFHINRTFQYIPLSIGMQTCKGTQLICSQHFYELFEATYSKREKVKGKTP